jgi:serine/threonine protein phosphatase 1
MNNLNKHIAFGDVHGCYKAAETAIKLSEKLNATAVFLGDYVDKGPSSMKVLEVLINAREVHPDWIFLRGNHDQMLLDLINGQKHPKGFDERTEKEAYAEWLLSPVELQKSVVNFLITTQFYCEVNEFIFVHAPLKDSTIPLHLKSENELIWNYESEPLWEGSRFIHGHYTTEEITYNGQGININTLCGYGGVLTGLHIDTKNNQDIIEHYSISEDGHDLNKS